MRWRLTLALSLIAVGLAAGLLLNSPRTVPVLLSEGELPPHQIEGLAIIRYDAQGAPAYRLTAEGAHYYPSQQRVDFAKPQLQLLEGEGQISWLIRASQAQLVQKQQLFLRGGIEATSLMAHTPLQGLRTEQMQLDLGSGAVTGEYPVLLYGEHWTAQGSGMQGNVNQRILTLLGAVRTDYASQR